MKIATTFAKRHKAQLRAQARTQRDGISHAEREQLSNAICARCLGLPAIREARSVFVYVSSNSEVATRRLIDDLVAANKQIYVPHVESKEVMKAVPFPGWAAMKPFHWGILAPAAPGPHTNHVDVTVVPGLAFDESGTRLGYGGGYYDRWLGANRAGEVFALAFEIQLCPKLPAARSDVAVQSIITERRLINCRA